MSINGFSTCQPSTIGTYRIPGTTRVITARKEIAPLLLGYAMEFHRLVEPIDGFLDDWGYVCKAIPGYQVMSFHAAGLAFDLNATKHPQGRHGTFSARQAGVIRALCQKYGLRWGGDYHTLVDEMHAEVILPRPAALALVARLQNTLYVPPTDPQPQPAPQPQPVLQEDLLMSAALNDDDARNCLIRQWYIEHVGHGPDGAGQADWLAYFRKNGADLTLAGIYDSAEAVAYRAKTPDAR